MGPLHGIRVLEIAGIGPAPFGCMLLADMGAEVVRVERAGDGRSTIDGAGRAESDPKRYVPHRGRRSIALDLKSPAGRDTLLALVEQADVLVEAFRPGAAERLGISPDDCLARNPRLVYARMTGWGQTGPLADRAGHDINYLGPTGALHAIGAAEKPLPPLNIGADFRGGAVFPGGGGPRPPPGRAG